MCKTKYWKAREFYNQYSWRKASYVTFLKRIKKYDLPYEIAIQFWNIEDNDPKWKRSKKKDSYRDYYQSYEWEKVNYRYFKDRIREWIPAEEAIKRLPKKETIIRYKPKKIKETVELIHDDSYYYIEITYSKEEAAVFRSMYIEKIVNNEEIIANTYLEPFELEKIRKKNEQLKKELEVFNKWNPL